MVQIHEISRFFYLQILSCRSCTTGKRVSKFLICHFYTFAVRISSQFVVLQTNHFKVISFMLLFFLNLIHLICLWSNIFHEKYCKPLTLFWARYSFFGSFCLLHCPKYYSQSQPCTSHTKYCILMASLFHINLANSLFLSVGRIFSSSVMP